MSEHTATLEVEDERTLSNLGGRSHQNLKTLAALLQVRVGARGVVLHVSGERQRAERVLLALVPVARKLELRGADIAAAVAAIDADPNVDLRGVLFDVVAEARGGRSVTPKTPGQKRYVDAIRAHDITLCAGPAGTGKTYLAVALAVDALRKQQVHRIVLARPAVEAGERLGFLPGDLEQKVNPYLRPLYDALDDLLGVDRAQEMLARRELEIAPLAFMRGRTLSDAFVILDEAQNTTREQMKMFLTRTGFGSKVVVTGDPTQADLPRGVPSGFGEAVRLLADTEGIAVCHLGEGDVVRHPLVQAILRAYDRANGGRDGA